MRSKVTPERRRVYRLNYLSKPDTLFKARSRGRCAQAIKSGKLTRLPCEKCGAVKTEAHHDDYSRPFDVRWLCKSCHCEAHRGPRTAPKTIAPGPTCFRGHALIGDNKQPRLERGRIRIVCRQCAREARAKYKRTTIQEISP